MLVLTRKKNESIVIAEDVTVTVVEIVRDRVRLGIVAPKNVSIRKEEANAIARSSEMMSGHANRAVVSETIARLVNQMLDAIAKQAVPLDRLEDKVEKAIASAGRTRQTRPKKSSDAEKE